MIRSFPEECRFEVPYRFTDPFRYVPHPLVMLAASEVISGIDADKDLSASFSEGKMLGVLVCRSSPQGMENNLTEVKNEDRKKGETPVFYIAAFSGNIDGRSRIEGFVPPIFDLTDPDGYFRQKEAEISDINRRLSELTSSERLSRAKRLLEESMAKHDSVVAEYSRMMAASKAARAQIRERDASPETEQRLIHESQHEKAGLRRLKAALRSEVEAARAESDVLNRELEDLKRQRGRMSDKLQDWIFHQYTVHNAVGETKSIADIFADKGLVPPGGTGECAAPKLLEYAYRNGFEPLAMGEFWYGKSPDTAVRTHGHFYPSCTSKCGPLLEYMLRGMTISRKDIPDEEIVTIYEDNAIIVVEKPSGMPSVPGLDGRRSLLERLSGTVASGQIHAVHRLDMDTSGVMVFAKTHEAAVNLRKQFEEHTVRKTYKAKVIGDRPLETDGSISLPLSPDYDERPRQKVDFRQGKQAYTGYEIVSADPDGTAEVLLYPHTGRTHQLRVHCAHHLGLGRPIAGDLLYGAHHVESSYADENGDKAARLCLHAFDITFRHPITGEPLTFSSDRLCYKKTGPSV